MFSLTDELSKFEKIVYSKQLEEIITIDDRFYGGGLSIQDLVRQNHFMITQLRKMKDAFVNYCKLNDKMYKKIVQHELNIAAQENRLKLTIQSMTNKINESVKTMSQLHQFTITENQKSEKMFQQTYTPIKQELIAKVDQTDLSPLVIKIIQKYDNGSQPQNGTENHGLAPLRRRKNAASSQELNLYKQELKEVLLKMEGKINLNKAQIVEQRVKIFGNDAAMAKNREQIDYAREEVRSLLQKSDQLNRSINTVHDSLMDEITVRTNDEVWINKFREFNENYIEKPINIIKLDIAQIGNAINLRFEQLVPKFVKIDSSIEQVSQKISPIQESLQKLQMQVDNAKNKIKEFQRQSTKKGQQLEKKITQTKQMLLKESQQLTVRIKKQIHSLSQQIINSENEIEQKVIKGVRTKFGNQLKQISNNIRELGTKLKQTTGKVNRTESQIQHLKDLVSKKANFTDLIVEADKKASKIDVQQLRQKLHSEPRHYFDTTTFKSKDTIQRPRRKSMLTSRNIMTPPHSKNLQQEDSSTKLFMCGFDDQAPDYKELKEFKEDKRLVATALQRKKNKSMRPTTAYTGGLTAGVINRYL